MTTIVTRSGKGAALTWAEADQNFTNLNSAKIESLSADTTPMLGGNLDTKSFTLTSSTGNVLIPDQVSLNGIWFDTTLTQSSAAPGQLVWNSAEGGLEYQMIGGNTTLQIGQEEVLRIHNNTGSSLTDGQVVYITGSTGERPTVALASASAELTSSNTIGMVTETIANGADGFITISGIVHGLNTNTLNAGDPVWLSTTAGTYTTTKPTAPNHSVFLGWVVKKSAGNGSIFIAIQNGYEIDELHNVSITTPANNDILKYNSTTGVWYNTAESDPVFAASPSFGITSTNITNWNTAFGWGNHASAGYQPTLVSGTNIKTINGSTVLGAGNLVISSGTGLGSLTAFKADGTQDDLPVNATTTLNQLTINQELLYNKNALIAIDVTGNYGWRDITSDINVKGNGTNNPSWGLIRNGLYAYVFSASIMQECWLNFHINHDYALNTPIYLHAHWVNPGTSTGVVRFGFEYTIAKGHQQEIFPATTTVYVEQACTGQYYHQVAEIATGITSASLEPDSIVMVRLFRDAAHVNDTCTNDIAIIASDIHYQANRFATKNKAPAFNV